MSIFLELSERNTIHQIAKDVCLGSPEPNLDVYFTFSNHPSHRHLKNPIV